jgi:hypothetical protein
MSLSIIGWCPVNIYILTQKTGVLQMVPRKLLGEFFFGNGSNDFDSISIIHRDHLIIQNYMGGIFRKITIYTNMS